MSGVVSDIDALRNAEVALDAINRASPLTRRRVTAILQSYNTSIERKIDRLSTMLQHDAAELFEMASNESALPFRAVQAEMKRMFLSVRHSSSPQMGRPGRPSQLTDSECYRTHLAECGLYDSLDAECSELLATIGKEERRGREQLQREMLRISEEPHNVCLCDDCVEYANHKVTRLLSNCLSSALAKQTEVATPSLGLPFPAQLIPSHICSQIKDALREALLLNLEAIELETYQQRVASENRMLREMRCSQVPSIPTRFSQSSDPRLSMTLSDFIFAYGECAVEHSSFVCARELDSVAVSRVDASWGIEARLRMLSRLLASI